MKPQFRLLPAFSVSGSPDENVELEVNLKILNLRIVAKGYRTFNSKLRLEYCGGTLEH